MSQETVTRAELEEFMVEQAAKRPEYKAALLSNPKAVLEQQIGSKLPEDVQVEVVQETASKIYIRLPHATKEGDQLKDEDLEQVAGGKSKSKDTVTCSGGGGLMSTKNEIHMK